MIVVDIETSGGPALDKYGIWQIGAIDLETGEEFLDECRIDDDEEIKEEALHICGKTEEGLRDKNKKSQKEMIKNFLKWVEKRKSKNIACLHPQFDIAFLWIKMNKYNLNSKYLGFPDYQRFFDLHTIAQIVYHNRTGKYLMKDDHSDMGLRNILGMFGIKDERRGRANGKFSGGKPHNALDDAKLEAECFKKLMKELGI